MTVSHAVSAQYIFKDAQESDGPVLMAVTDCQGRVVGRPDGGPEPGTVAEALVRLAAPAGHLSDKMFSITHEMILSERAWEAIRSLTPGPHLQAVPVTVLQGSKSPVGKGWWLVPMVRYDALHPRLARYRMNRGMNTISRVDHWALDQNRVPPVDLWFEEHGRWFVSERLRDMWESEDFTGARFTEVAVG